MPSDPLAPTPSTARWRAPRPRPGRPAGDRGAGAAAGGVGV